MCFMQKLILVLLFITTASLSANAQSLKELLYGGKLRMDSNTVLRKTDDLNSRIDPNAKKRADSLALIAEAARADSIKASAAIAGIGSNGTVVTEAGVSANSDGTIMTAAPAGYMIIEGKTNAKIWKEYADSLASMLKPEISANKRLKSGTYNITVTYEINTDGSVTFNNVTATPENTLLQSQVKQMMESMPFRLHPTLDGNNQPRKTKRSQNFSVTKD